MKTINKVQSTKAYSHLHHDLDIDEVAEMLGIRTMPGNVWCFSCHCAVEAEMDKIKRLIRHE